MIFASFRQKSRQNQVYSINITGLHPVLSYCARFGAFSKILVAHLRTYSNMI